MPPVRAAAPVPAVPFSRASLDPNAPPPTKAPTMSLKIGGGGKPATVSLNIGGGPKKDSPAASEKTTPASSKVPTPNSSKPATPVPGEKAKASPAKDAPAEKTAAPAARKAEIKEETKTSDALLAEVKAAADEETLQDLYGKDDEGLSIFYTLLWF